MEVLNPTRSSPSVQKNITRLSESVAQSDEGKPSFRVNIRPLITVLGHKVAELLKQLGGRSQSAKQEEEYQKCAPATGDWLLNMEQYMKWKISRNNLLWIKGAGKWLPQY